MQLDFGTPVTVESGEKKNFSLLVDIDSLATADNFILSLNDGNNIEILDDNSLQPVTIASSVTFPLQTASCRIDDPSQEMLVSYTALLPPHVNVGQNNVSLVYLKLRHPGSLTSSQIQLTGLTVSFTDELGAAIPADNVADEVNVLHQQTIIGGVQSIPSGTVEIDIPLGSPLTLSPDEVDSILIRMSVAADISVSSFGMTIPDSTAFEVRDLSSHSILEAASDDLLQLGDEDVFPILAGVTSLNDPAVPPELCPVSLLPYSTVGGKDTLSLIDFAFNYDAAPNKADIYLQSISVQAIDSSGTLLDPNRLFDRIGYQIEGQAPVYQTFVQVLGANTIFDLGQPGIAVSPGESLNVRLIADIEADAPYDNFVLMIPSTGWLEITDANDSTSALSYSPGDNCAAEYPFMTNMTRIFLPAGRPVLETESLPVQLAGPNQEGLSIYQGHLDYSQGGAGGDIALSGLTGRLLKRTGDGYTSTDASELFDAVYLSLDGQTVATDSAFAGDTIRLIPETAFTLESGVLADLNIAGDIRADVDPANYIMIFDDSTSFSMADLNLATAVYPLLSGSIFPVYSAEISLAAAGLKNSFTNYPNPFNPDVDGHTVIGYTLDEDAHVDIELFTVTGEAVKDVLKNGFRGEGSHDEDVWSGQNDVNLDVLPGTYFCRITAHYISGRTECYKRKISIVR